MTIRSIGIGLLVALALIALPAQAQDTTKIFLNEVDITGAADIELTEVKAVKIDAQGNVHIDAPQYQVETEQDANAGNAAGNGGGGDAIQAESGGEYYLIGTNTNPGKAGFDIEIYVNGVLRRTIRNEEDQVVVNISKHLIPGTNTVVFKARKKTNKARLSTSPADRISIMVGKGNATANQLTIERQLATFSVNASENADKNQTITLEVK